MLFFNKTFLILQIYTYLIFIIIWVSNYMSPYFLTNYLIIFTSQPIYCTWNQFKCENLDNSNYDNSYDSGDFSYACVIMHQYSGKKTKNVKNGYISFYKQLYMFFCMIIS
jgi:hypothetical protein